jgi:hypothetical protein
VLAAGAAAALAAFIVPSLALGSGGPGGGGGGGGGGTVATTRLRRTGPCGIDQLVLRIKPGPGGGLDAGVNLATNATWDVTLTQQDHDAVTGGKVGPEILLFSGPVTAVADEAGVDVPAVDNDGMTHGFSYTAVQEGTTSPVCAQTGYWTNPAGPNPGPVAQNPGSKPNTAPVPTGTVEADAGTNQVLVEFNEPLDPTAVAVPSRFAVSGKNGAGVNFTRAVSSVSIDPANPTILTLTLAANLPAAGTVQVQYTRPLTGASLQDPDGLKAANFTLQNLPIT